MLARSPRLTGSCDEALWRAGGMLGVGVLIELIMLLSFSPSFWKDELERMKGLFDEC